MTLTEQILSQLPGDVLAQLRRVDTLWKSLKENTAPIPNVVKENPTLLGEVDFDAVICGGTLGILAIAIPLHPYKSSVTLLFFPYFTSIERSKPIPNPPN